MHAPLPTTPQPLVGRHHFPTPNPQVLEAVTEEFLSMPAANSTLVAACPESQLRLAAEGCSQVRPAPGCMQGGARQQAVGQGEEQAGLSPAASCLGGCMQARPSAHAPLAVRLCRLPILHPH